MVVVFRNLSKKRMLDNFHDIGTILIVFYQTSEKDHEKIEN